MGYFQKNVTKGTKVAIISANDPEGSFSVRLYINNGETASARKPMKSKTLKGAMKAAETLLSK